MSCRQEIELCSQTGAIIALLKVAQMGHRSSEPFESVVRATIILLFFQCLKLHKRHCSLWNKNLSFFQLNVCSLTCKKVVSFPPRVRNNSEVPAAAEQATTFPDLQDEDILQQDIFLTILIELLLGTTQLCFVRLPCLCFNPLYLSICTSQ